ncbi:MAG TPA: RNA polymerase sigma factor [Kineosporiaceae bacterium]|nr:RNA polymerase sigma factor [Kineosporiaceae bacterium]
MAHDGGAVTPPEQRSTELEEALTRARAGDEGGFVLLYRGLQPGILRYVATLVGGDAEDVAAEAWLQVARDLRKFSGDLDGFRGWVATIARHRALDHLRARARRPVVLDDLVALADRPAGDDTSEHALERLRTAQAVALVAALPREMAEAVMLRAVVGLDVAGTAAVLGKRPATVRVAAHRGLKRLAEQLRRGQQAGGPALGGAPAGGNEA